MMIEVDKAPARKKTSLSKCGCEERGVRFQPDHKLGFEGRAPRPPGPYNQKACLQDAQT